MGPYTSSRSFNGNMGNPMERLGRVGSYLDRKSINKSPGFWSFVEVLNRIRTEKGRSKSLLYKWRTEKSPLCSCGIEQTVKHIVEECSVTRFEGGITKLHETKAEAINLLNNLEIPL